MARSPAGGAVAAASRGQEQIVQGLADARRAAAAGVRSVLIADVGLLDVFAEARRRDFLPADMQAKISVMLPVANPATARVLVALGADTLNLTTDLSLAQIAAIRAVVDVPLDIYVEVPDNVGGFVRLHEIPEIVRVAAPVYLKFGLRNAPDVYPAGTHLEATTVALTRERVRRARLGMELLAREWPGLRDLRAGRARARARARRERRRRHARRGARRARRRRGPAARRRRHVHAVRRRCRGQCRDGPCAARPVVAFIGRVGDDGLGQMVRNGLRGEGVDVRWLSDDPDAPTGALARDRRSFPPAEVVYLRRGSAASRLEPADVEAAGETIAGARWLHLTGITPALSPSCRAAVQRALQFARAGGVRVSLDVNLRRRLWSEQEAAPVLAELAERCDLVSRARTRPCCCAARPRPPRWPSDSASRRSSSSVRAARSAGATASWRTTRASRWRRWMSSAPATRSRPVTSTPCSTAPAWPSRCGARTPAARSPSRPSATRRACPRAPSWSGCWRAARDVVR